MDLGIAMRRAVLCCALMLLPSAALAEGWTAQMEEDEGGPTMVASIIGSADGSVTPELRLMCAGTEGVNLRYEGAAEGAEPGSEGDFTLTTDKTSVTKHMLYEDMDGAFAAYFQPSDPTIALLKGGKTVTLSDKSGKSPDQTFPLTGSSKAIDALLKTCQ